MPASPQWLVAVLSAAGGGMAGSVTTAALRGRERRRTQARKRLHELQGRLGVLEAAKTQADLEIARLSAAYGTLRAELGDLESDLGNDRQEGTQK